MPIDGPLSRWKSVVGVVVSVPVEKMGFESVWDFVGGSFEGYGRGTEEEGAMPGWIVLWIVDIRFHADVGDISAQSADNFRRFVTVPFRS